MYKTIKTYLIAAGETGKVKIGKSRDPWERLAQLQTGNPEPLRFIAIMEGEAFHSLFADVRLEGEWFEGIGQSNLVRKLENITLKSVLYSDPNKVKEFIAEYLKERDPQNQTGGLKKCRRFRSKWLNRLDPEAQQVIRGELKVIKKQKKLARSGVCGEQQQAS